MTKLINNDYLYFFNEKLFDYLIQNHFCPLELNWIFLNVTQIQTQKIIFYSSNQLTLVSLAEASKFVFTCRFYPIFFKQFQSKSSSSQTQTISVFYPSNSFDVEMSTEVWYRRVASFYPLPMLLWLYALRSKRCLAATTHRTCCVCVCGTRCSHRWILCCVAFTAYGWAAVAAGGMDW